MRKFYVASSFKNKETVMNKLMGAKKREVSLDIKYLVYDTIPNNKLLNGIINLYSDVFGGNDKELLIKMKNKPKLLFNIALYDQKVVGFKIGYELDNNKFYSWLGGVHPDYRKHGIALTLMEKQHEYLRGNGYKVVQTKTMNKWRNMLILNIKNGFDVIETYTDDNGLQKIVLEKTLLN
ncbi:GNAT family N-acetyltransferase [Pseudogracilibacillus sp. SE30717A]|uniref:GNAT family N-acetyltransferase n=1 Tax=Pseudogracilibacillus sp. SE30717A TaxID=3098293 RepID=UPI00300E1DEF